MTRRQRFRLLDSTPESDACPCLACYPPAVRTEANTHILAAPSLTWAGQTFTLLPQRAMLWHEADTLILADPHFGKAASFRAAGIPVPGGTTDAMLHRLSRLLSDTHARRLLILGDFFHARSGVSDAVLAALSEWRLHHRRVEVVVLRGNHDRHAGAPPEQLGFDVGREELREGSLVFRHQPGDGADVGDDGSHIIAGHVHPAVRLLDRDRGGRGGGGTMKAPCFLFRHRGATLLPAFGLFTGTHVVRPHRGDRVFALGAESVVEVGGGAEHQARPLSSASSSRT